MTTADQMTARAIQLANVGNAYCDAAMHIEQGCCVKADPEIAAWLSNLGDLTKEQAIALQVQAQAFAREAGQ